ncbi:uncharacterized protein LOC115455980 [Manduca sexta]|uniref:uncharacterized protein LOC115455980 n=1 Tax=Manduca sexta TaxID=7130 RepID=UPI0018904770|nr:uncharacterized protein LOC115455980 [Manduca sexta]
MMYWLLFFLSIHTLTNAGVVKTNTPCEGINANFNLKTVIGSWHVVAVFPDRLFPDKDIVCYKVEISETDEASLRWLVNKTLDGRPTTPLSDTIKGTVVRQRYHTEHPFDLWSKSAKGINGCFQQVVSLDLSNPRHVLVNDVLSDISKTGDAITMMQLHLMDAADGSDPFLVQILWGRLISAVIYRKTQGVTQEQLKPVYEFLSRVRGPQRLPKICENTLQDILML